MKILVVPTCPSMFSPFVGHATAMSRVSRFLTFLVVFRGSAQAPEAPDCERFGHQVAAIADGGIHNFHQLNALQSLQKLIELPSLRHCSWRAMAAKMLSDYIGYGLVQDGNSGVAMDSEMLARFWDLRVLADGLSGVNKSWVRWVDLWLDETKNKHNKTTLEWEIRVLTKKFWAMTTNDEKDFKDVVKNLKDYAPIAPAGSQAQVVCVHGVTHLAKESLVFSHFTWGHVYPVAVAVAKAGFLHRGTKLVFDAQPFLRPRVTWLAFYGLFFDEIPKFDPFCQGATAQVDLDEAVPLMTQYTAENFKNNHTLSDQNTWERNFELCTWRPKIFKAMAARFNFPFHHGRVNNNVNVVYLRRGVIGAVGRARA